MTKKQKLALHILERRRAQYEQALQRLRQDRERPGRAWLAKDKDLDRPFGGKVLVRLDRLKGVEEGDLTAERVVGVIYPDLDAAGAAAFWREVAGPGPLEHEFVVGFVLGALQGLDLSLAAPRAEGVR